MTLTHEVSISFQEGSLCLECGDDKLHADKVGEGGRPILVCYNCGAEHESLFRRWRSLYPRVPESDKYDVFRSLEKIDTQGNLTVEFAVDIDGGGGDTLQEVHEKLVAVAGDVFDVYESGSKGYHLHIPYEKWRYANADWPAVFRRLAENLDMLGVIDTAIYMNKAMFRVEGSVNSKSGKPKALLHKGSLSAPLPTWEEAVKRAEEEAPKGQKYVASNKPVSQEPFHLLKQYTPPCIAKLWLDGIPAPGTRHQVYLHLISYYFRRGDSEEECVENMNIFAQEFGENTNTPLAMREHEAERLTRHAYSHGVTFECTKGETLGICEVSCKLYR